jgi:hypothetical protein
VPLGIREKVPLGIREKVPLGIREKVPHQDEPYFLVQGQVTMARVPVDVIGPTNGPMG